MFFDGMKMKEEYLHYLYRFKLLGNNFKTVDGKSLEILDFGQYNLNAGPDFLNAALKLDNKLWIGPVEFHVHASDWYLHKHQLDERYSNVIAHFVYEHDGDVQSGAYVLPTVELKSKIDPAHYRRYLNLSGSASAIACQSQLAGVDPIVIFQQKERALIQRLTRKSQLVLNDIKANKGNIEKAFYHALARVFGGKVNTAVFEQLVQRLDLIALRRVRGNSFTTAAVVFGLSGLLPTESTDEYVKKLTEEFSFQAHRLAIVPINAPSWRYSRMYAGGFPDIRLAQFASLLDRELVIDRFLSQGISVAEIRELLKIELPLYWQTHYRFEKLAKLKNPALSNGFIDLLIINAVVPFLFANGILQDNQAMKDRALELLLQLKPEQNNILLMWSKSGVVATSAFDSQALIEQKNELCSAKKCLFCSIGTKLLRA